MKNKIKKIIPLILCFVMIAGSCLTVNAAKRTAETISTDSFKYFGFTNYNEYLERYDFYYYKFDILSSSDNVFFLPIRCVTQEKCFLGSILVSSSPFTLQYYSSGGSGSSEVDYESLTLTSVVDGSIQSFSMNGESFYYFVDILEIKSAYADTSNKVIKSTCGFINPLSFIDTFDRTSSSYSNLIYALFNNDFIYDDGKASVYDTQPTASIEPPQNLSIYRGYSNADKQYKFQMQWDKPADTDLNVEVMYNIHWKEGTGSALGFGTHVYKKYQHLVYDDGHSAQTNKLQYLEDDLLKGYFESQNMEVPSVYNIDEIYVRFAKEVDGIVQYSLWRKIDYMNLDEGNGFDSTEDDFQAESSTGAFDTSDNWIDQSVQNGEIVNGSEKEDAKAPGLDANGDNITNVDKPIVNPDSWDGQFEGVFAQFTNAIKSAFSFVGEFPSMLSEFFGFLPASVIGCISIGLIMVVVLRFLGR